MFGAAFFSLFFFYLLLVWSWLLNFWHSFNPKAHLLLGWGLLFSWIGGLSWVLGISFMPNRTFFLRTNYYILLMDAYKLDKLCNRLWAFGVKILILLHISHLLMQLDHNRYELLLISLLSLVKFNDPLLEYIEQRVDAVIVSLFLETSGKPWIYRHTILL